MDKQDRNATTRGTFAVIKRGQQDVLPGATLCPLRENHALEHVDLTVRRAKSSPTPVPTARASRRVFRHPGAAVEPGAEDARRSGLMLMHAPEILFLDEPTDRRRCAGERNRLEFIQNINREKG